MCLSEIISQLTQKVLLVYIFMLYLLMHVLWVNAKNKTEYKQGRTAVVCMKEGPPIKEKKTERSYQLKRDEGNHNSPKTSNGKFTKFPRTNKIQSGNRDRPAYLYTYSRLLKDGRYDQSI